MPFKCQQRAFSVKVTVAATVRRFLRDSRQGGRKRQYMPWAQHEIVPINDNGLLQAKRVAAG